MASFGRFGVAGRSPDPRSTEEQLERGRHVAKTKEKQKTPAIAGVLGLSVDRPTNCGVVPKF